MHLYLILFNAILTNPSNIAHGHEGIYFVENAEYMGYELTKATSEALIELGNGTTREANSDICENTHHHCHPVTITVWMCPHLGMCHQVLPMHSPGVCPPI